MNDCWHDCLQILTCGLIHYGKCNYGSWSLVQPLLTEVAAGSRVPYPGPGRPSGNSPDQENKFSAAARSNILGHGHGRLGDAYDLGKLLGRGADGVVRIAVQRRTGQRYACKTLFKRWLHTRAKVEALRKEVLILQLLSGHPNVTSLIETIEDDEAVHLILVLAEGGELLQHLGARGAAPPTEALVGRLLGQMARFLAHAHALGILHRDLKLENFLLSSPELDKAQVMAADFGLSAFVRPGRTARGAVGSAYYMAPEVLAGRGGAPADVWGLGVIVHLLLSGLAPFWGDSEEEVWDAAVRARPAMALDPWPRVSRGAKQLVRAMVCRDPGARPTAAQIAAHPWCNGAAPDDARLGAVVHDRLHEFAVLSRMRQVAMLVAEEQLSHDTIPELQGMFLEEDGGHQLSGEAGLTPEMICAGMRHLGHNLTLQESESLFISLGGQPGPTGTVPWSTFAIALLGLSAEARRIFIRGFFSQLDGEGNGGITRARFVEALAQFGVDPPDATLVFEQATAPEHHKIMNVDDWTSFLAINTRSLQEVIRHQQTAIGAVERSYHSVV